MSGVGVGVEDKYVGRYVYTRVIEVPLHRPEMGALDPTAGQAELGQKPFESKKPLSPLLLLLLLLLCLVGGILCLLLILCLRGPYHAHLRRVSSSSFHMLTRYHAHLRHLHRFRHIRHTRQLLVRERILVTEHILRAVAVGSSFIGLVFRAWIK